MDKRFNPLKHELSQKYNTERARNALKRNPSATHYRLDILNYHLDILKAQYSNNYDILRSISLIEQQLINIKALSTHKKPQQK